MDKQTASTGSTMSRLSIRRAPRSALASLLIAASAMGIAAPAMAAISAAERQVLIDLYTSTSGDAWTTNSGWKTAGVFSAPGTECAWAGISCDAAGNHVVQIKRSSNNLTGSLPATLNTLTALEVLFLSDNHLSGNIPSLVGLTQLTDFNVGLNELTGTIPSLSGSPALNFFNVSVNLLTGSLPDLSALSALRTFYASDNQLTGTIPSLDNLTALEFFGVNNNRLSGTPPAAPGALRPSGSSLCPNLLHTPSPTDVAWNAARGSTWSLGCTPGYLVNTSSGWNGEIEKPQGVQAGQTATVAITPNLNYVIDTVFSSCGGTLVGNTFTTGPVNADCSVSAHFKIAPGAIMPNVLNTFGGSARCTPERPGSASTCTATPEPGFYLQRIEGCGGMPSATSPYTTAPLTAVCLVSVTFLATPPPTTPTTPVPVPVPTLGQWMLMALGLLLGGFGARRARHPTR